MYEVWVERQPGKWMLMGFHVTYARACEVARMWRFEKNKRAFVDGDIPKHAK